MRVKISFFRDNNSANSIPLHHQKLLNAALTGVISGIPVKDKNTFYNFSSLKGTSKIQNGFMRFLSSKVTLAVSSNNAEFIKQFVKALMDKERITIGKMILVPRSFEEIPDPEFNTRMRYLCISPLVLHDPLREPERSQEMLDPTSQQFSDILFNQVLDKMEKAGFTEEKLNDFAEFEATPDREYVEKVNQSGKKFARFYKCKEGSPMMGYLIPFTLHAHPEVHKFIWECGMGVLTEQGYGMVDTVKL